MRLRALTLAAGAAGALTLAGCGGSAGHAAAPATTTTATTTPAPVLSPDDQFLAALQASGYPPYAYSSVGGIPDVESFGRTVCTAIERGIPYSQIVSTVTEWPAGQTAAIVQAAHTGYCPQYPMSTSA